MTRGGGLAWRQASQICAYDRAERGLTQDSGCVKRRDKIHCHPDRRAHFPAVSGAGSDLMTKFWPIFAPEGF